MSNFEIILIVLACAVPVVALIFILPKIKKKEKTKVETSTKTYEEIKKEESEKEIIEEKPKEKKINIVPKNDFSPDDFRSYLNNRQRNMSKPSRIEHPEGFQDRTMPYTPRRARRAEAQKTIAEEIRSLSPELKALIFTGALDKKDFK